jgi:hypothetical protein
MCRSGEVGDAQPLEHLGDLGFSVRVARAAAGRLRDMRTHSATVTGKFQLTVSSWGT